MSDFSDEFLDAGGIKTHYLEAGKENHTVILVHGGGAGADAYSNWKTCIPLYARNFRVVAVDMPGFGKTAKPDPVTYDYSQPSRNKWLVNFIRNLDRGPVSVIGNSMGGATALGAAMMAPELIDKLVLIGSAGLPRTAASSKALEVLSNYDFTIEGMRKIFETLTGPSFVIDEELVRYRHEISIDPAAKAAYKATMGWAKERGGLQYTEDEIRKVKTPTLVVNGKDDQVVPLANAYKFLELLENSWGCIIPHCGHWAMAEYPEYFVNVTENFLRKAS